MWAPPLNVYTLPSEPWIQVEVSSRRPCRTSIGLIRTMLDSLQWSWLSCPLLNLVCSDQPRTDHSHKTYFYIFPCLPCLCHENWWSKTTRAVKLRVDLIRSYTTWFRRWHSQSSGHHSLIWQLKVLVNATEAPDECNRINICWLSRFYRTMQRKS